METKCIVLNTQDAASAVRNILGELFWNPEEDIICIPVKKLLPHKEILKDLETLCGANLTDSTIDYLIVDNFSI